jgi:undecaprenyl-diphosphatase
MPDLHEWPVEIHLPHLLRFHWITPVGEFTLVVFLILAYLTVQRIVQRNLLLAIWDIPISRWLVSRAAPLPTRFFAAITDLGKYTVIRLAGVVIGIGLVLLGDWRRGVMVVALIGVTVFISRYLKHFVPRKRPDFPQNFLYDVDTTFPSGHTLLSTAFYWMVAYLAWLYFRESPLGWAVIAGALLMIVLIGFSRVYLGLHFASDVLGGWIAGSAFFLLILCSETVLFYRPGLLHILVRFILT